MSAARELFALGTVHDCPDRSMSPIFSNFGLIFAQNEPSVKELVLHYNRKTRTIWSPLVSFPGEGSSESTFLSTVVKTGKGEFEIAFYDTDAFIVDGSAEGPVSVLAESGCALADHWTERDEKDLIVVRGYSANGDERDPDEFAPVCVGVRVIRGVLSRGGDGVSILPDADGKVCFALACGVLGATADGIAGSLENAPSGAAEAKELTAAWALRCAGGIGELPTGDKEREVYLTAVSGLLMNLKKAPGDLAGRVSAFPSRGGYPTHFMWDSAFQNLAYEIMSPDIAADALTQLAANARPDGKIPQFICSTWARPHHAQPALLGQAAKRLVERVGPGGIAAEDLHLIREAVERNNEWWLTQRVTRYGLISCPHGLETGQDDSPRFDDGPVLAVDMNSYLLSQMRAAAYLASVEGDGAAAIRWDERADAFSALMIRYLYDPDKDLFFDADARTGERRSLITASCFLPLWAGVKISEDKARDMIGRYLLDEKYFFGAVPFPSVAYCEAKYEPAHWWRGPTWMPVAYMMLELLGSYGFKERRDEAAKRLLDIMTRDGVLHELFDSRTGEGLGCEEQGWTAAIYIRLTTELGERGGAI